VSVTSITADQPSAKASLRAISDSSKRKLARLAGTSTVLTASLAALAIGIFIGNAARKRIDRATHGYS
jgi:2-methylcitrate dehydratase PrpD